MLLRENTLPFVPCLRVSPAGYACTFPQTAAARHGGLAGVWCCLGRPRPLKLTLPRPLPSVRATKGSPYRRVATPRGYFPPKHSPLGRTGLIDAPTTSRPSFRGPLSSSHRLGHHSQHRGPLIVPQPGASKLQTDSTSCNFPSRASQALRHLALVPPLHVSRTSLSPVLRRLRRRRRRSAAVLRASRRL